MTNTDNTPEEKVTNPFAAVSAKEEPKDLKSQELADELLSSNEEYEQEVEADESFFWIVQRALWGVLKSFIILLVLAGIIWMIWGVQSVKIPDIPGISNNKREANDDAGGSNSSDTSKKNGISFSITPGEKTDEPEKKSDSSANNQENKNSEDQNIPTDSKPGEDGSSSQTKKKGLWGRFSSWTKSLFSSDKTETAALDESDKAGGDNASNANGNNSNQNNTSPQQGSSNTNNGQGETGPLNMDGYSQSQKDNYRLYNPKYQDERLWITGSQPLSIDLRDSFNRGRLPRIEASNQYKSYKYTSNSQAVRSGNRENGSGFNDFEPINNRNTGIGFGFSNGHKSGSNRNGSGLGNNAGGNRFGGNGSNGSHNQNGNFNGGSGSNQGNNGSGNSGFGGNSSGGGSNGSGAGGQNTGNNSFGNTGMGSNGGSVNIPGAGSMNEHLSHVERLVRVAESLGEIMYERDHSSLVGQTVSWLRAAKQFSLVETQAVSDQASPSERAEKIAQRIEHAELLFADARKIRAELDEQVRLWTATRDQNRAEADIRRKRMFDGVANYQGAQAERAMQNLAAANQNIALSEAYLEMYQSLLKNVNNFERLMRQSSIKVF